MLPNIFYLILAAFGLGFLVFIHEMGHYLMAKRMGMTIEAFSIGFGKPFLSWEKNGVKWNVCILPFGGYVRIKGMEQKGSQDPYQIPDGYFGKSPRARIKVALAGPVSNMIFAFIAFSVLWVFGGREKPFADFTHLIGWTDTCSELHQKGVRAGDEIVSYNHRPYNSFQDVIYGSVTKQKEIDIKGYKIDYTTKNREPFDYRLEAYSNPLFADPSFTSIGVLGPASFLMFYEKNQNYFKPEFSIYHSGIQDGDRVVWVDGELVFSLSQLSAIANEPKALLTVQREGKTFLTRIPRLKISDLQIAPAEKNELEDWLHASGTKAKIESLYFIPYNLTNQGVVEREIVYLDETSRECRYSTSYRSPMSIPLKVGDQILAVDGKKISSSIDLLQQLQNREVRIIVHRAPKKSSPLSWKEADRAFVDQIDWTHISNLSSKMGTAEEMAQSGNYYLLAAIKPLPFSELPLSGTQKANITRQLNAQKKQIEELTDPQEKAEALRAYENQQKRLIIGIVPQDLLVVYNPSPLKMFSDVLKDTARTLSSLFSGTLSPKWMSGPVGIIQVMQHSWSTGIRDALFWLGLVSLNLGLLNLLPIPVLDGGHICFSLYEMATKRRIKPKTMERLIIPFVVLLIAFFVFLTYHDLARLLSQFLNK